MAGVGQVTTRDLEKAIRTLRFRDRHRRFLAVCIIAWGISMAALGWWTIRIAGQSIEELAGALPDESLAAIPIAVAFVVGLSCLAIGGVAMIFGTVRIFIPDPKTTVLLDLVDRGGSEKEGTNFDET